VFTLFDIQARFADVVSLDRAASYLADLEQGTAGGR
jgi:hypothetical protein